LLLYLLLALGPGFGSGCGREAAPPVDVESMPVHAGTLADAVAAAQPGDTIVLPAGIYEAGITLPPRVGLRGAGYRKTILDARNAEVGLAIEGADGAEIADLTVWGAGETRADVLVRGGANLALRRVRATGGLNGVNFAGVTNGRIENVVCDENRYGIVVSGGRGNAVVNCTVVRNSSLGLSFPSGEKTLVFNNCIADSATGVSLGEPALAGGVHLDHNLYFSRFVGKLAGQLGRRTLGDWQALSGQDRFSVQLPLAFRAPEAGDYRPAGTLAWSLERAPTSDWGVPELSGVKAPETDIDGNPRAGLYDLGAYEFAPPANLPRPPDGTLTVRSGAGITSTGVFAPGGREVAYLFHNLPLPAGPHFFWLPSRDFEGRPIAAGTYGLRTLESALRWEYLGAIGDTGAAFPPSRSAPVKPFLCGFDGAGGLVVGNGWSEDATNLRGYDAATGHWLWAFGGSSDIHGLAVRAEDGTLYLLRASGSKGLITRHDARTGKPVPWGEGDRDRDAGSFTFEGGAGASGLAVLEGRLYVADARASVLRHGPIAPPALDQSSPVPAPTSLAADPAARRLWVISGGKTLVALDPQAKVVAQAAPVEAPAALAIRDGRLAVASRATGKIHFFDARDPTALKPTGTLGTGDGPFGPYRPDRFLFQRGGTGTETEPGGDVSLAMGPEGELAITEENRVLVFDRHGKSLWTTFGLAGDACVPSFADRGRVFTLDGRKSLRLDEASGTWAPEAFWDVPRGGFLGAFADGKGAATLGVFVAATGSQRQGPLLVVRYDGYTARPALQIPDPKSKSEKDLALTHRIDTTLQPRGDVLALGLHPETWGILWRYDGLDPHGTPLYRLEDRPALPRKPGALLSPYTRRADPSAVLVGAVPDDDDDGGFTGLINFRTSPYGTGLLATAGTDLVRLDPSGERLWDHPLAEHRGLEGLERAGPLLLTGVAATCEVLAFNRDGLGLGSFGFRPEVHYPGFFLDQPRALRAYRGGDNRIYALVADSVAGVQHWYRLHGEDSLVSTESVLTLSAPAARSLAALPPPPAPAPARPAPPTVRVPRLGTDLPIDGSLEKWRAAGIAPQVVVTPETATGAIDGPGDTSAVIRLAYRGNSLYLQVLTFDDAPTFHQPVVRHHQQDGVELCINGFLPGFKFDITRTSDAGPIVLRQRFTVPNLDLLIPPEHAPRIIKVLKDARDVPERRLIESIYGVDLAGSPVIVTECKLPIAPATYKDAVKDLFPLKPGQTFRLGFLINDNDNPGTDVQNYLVWPATYGNFNPVDDMAIAVLE
jgi:hypothetical protein